jgi:hypothetical protein
MDKQLSFFHVDNQSEKVESHAQSIRKPTDGGTKAVGRIDIKKPQKTFYAKSSSAPPMYTAGKNGQVMNHKRSMVPNSATTGAFFGLISVILLTSFVFVRGSHVVQQRWAAVRERMEEQRQMRHGVEDI